MKLDRYTQKAQEAILAAQQLAAGAKSPVLDVEHLLAALLDDPEGIPAMTLRQLGADPAAVAMEVGAVLGRRAKIEGGQLSLDPRMTTLIGAAEDEAKRLGDEYVSTEHLLLAASRAGGDAQRLLEQAGAAHEALLGALEAVRGSQRVTSANPEATYQSLAKYGIDLTAAAREGALDPVVGRDEEDPARHPGAQPPDQEQPGAHRRAGRGQDRHRGRPGPAHRSRRRARRAARQEGRGPGPRRAHRRGQVPR